MLVWIKALLSLLVLCGELLNRGSTPLVFGSRGERPIQGSPEELAWFSQTPEDVFEDIVGTLKIECTPQRRMVWGN